MSVSFVIEAWAACAPGLDTPQRWTHWAAQPWLPEGEPQVALAAVTPMLRRRFAPLGRLVAQSVFDLAPTTPRPVGDAVPEPVPSALEEPGHPTVFASRYGETSRCLDLLADQARGDAMSPTAFGLSVHNAIGAMIAIARGDRSNSTAIAAGRATAAAGVAEAVALLEDGAPSASLVVYDAPLPAAYLHFADEPSAHFAWAWRLRRPRAGERALHLEWRDAAAPVSGDPGPAGAGRFAPASADAAPPARLPASLQALWFGLCDAPVFDQHLDGACCRWSRDV